MIRTALILLLVLSSAACSSLRGPAEPGELPSTFPNHDATAIATEAFGPLDAIDAFAADARISLRSPQQSGSFNARISYRRGDSLTIALSPGLGFVAARMLMTPDSFFVYDRLKNTLSYGSRARAEELLPASFASSDLFGSLLGFPEMPPPETWSVDATDAHYRIRAERQESFVDPTSWRVVRFVEHTPDQVLLDERTYSQFDRFGSWVLPRHLTLRRPAEESAATLHYQDLDINPSQLDFSWDVPDGVKRQPV